jgi:signal peptidase I
MSTLQRSKAREYLEALLIAVIFLKFANTFLIQTFYIPSGSMKPTLLVGDHLFVNRFIYGPTATELERKLLPVRSVERGDVVIFRSVEDPTIDVVKRTVGVAGDEVQLVAKQLFLNGERVEDDAYAVHLEPGAQQLSGRERLEAIRRDYFGPFEVPPQHYFLLGDNRDNSHDSRFWGPLPAHMVKGRALFIYWSFDGDYHPEGRGTDSLHALEGKLKHFVSTLTGFFTKTRWGRTLRLIR